ncbi:hypothetical protein [Halomonas caseinilytica]|uniref:hypothetical protein n=1 Tax=Halomonas caseinilytica TaxID=438744 RepID=UPI0007E53EB1|nr:hypothetical protein [Halomonas caseinilytica]
MQEYIKQITEKVGNLNIIAITVLALFIISFCVITGISLAGISTFGLLLVAISALHYTKHQAQEWRRREAYHLATSLDEELKESLKK